MKFLRGSRGVVCFGVCGSIDVVGVDGAVHGDDDDDTDADGDDDDGYNGHDNGDDDEDDYDDDDDDNDYNIVHKYMTMGVDGKAVYFHCFMIQLEQGQAGEQEAGNRK